jgi:tetratricopeptide (TPR) repeat protein
MACEYLRKWVRTSLVVVALAVGGGVAATPVAAQTESSDAAARRLYTEGRKAFDLGEFEKAVVAYKAAYKAKPDAAFLFNIAQAYRLANDPTQAAFFYKSFLRNRPDAPNRAEIEERIKQMDEATRKAAAAPPAAGPVPQPAPAPQPAPPPDPVNPAAASAVLAHEPNLKLPAPAEPQAAVAATSAQEPSQDSAFYTRPWFWGVAGAVLAGVIVGVVLASGRGGNAPSTRLGTKPVF